MRSHSRHSRPRDIWIAWSAGVSVKLGLLENRSKLKIVCRRRSDELQLLAMRVPDALVNCAKVLGVEFSTDAEVLPAEAVRVATGLAIYDAAVGSDLRSPGVHLIDPGWCLFSTGGRCGAACPRNWAASSLLSCTPVLVWPAAPPDPYGFCFLAQPLIHCDYSQHFQCAVFCSCLRLLARPRRDFETQQMEAMRRQDHAGDRLPRKSTRKLEMRKHDPSLVRPGSKE